MNNPPNGLYRKPFDPSLDPNGPTTVDGKRIVQGLRVFTNNLDRGTVDLSRAEWEWHGPENRYHLWFDVNVETTYKGQPAPAGYRVSQSDDRVTTRFEGKDA